MPEPEQASRAHRCATAKPEAHSVEPGKDELSSGSPVDVISDDIQDARVILTHHDTSLFDLLALAMLIGV